MNANDLLMGGGIKSAAFPDGQYGTTVGGPIVRTPEVRQQTDFDTGKPKCFDNGDPMMQIVVHVQTELRDPVDATDDGVRGFYLKGQMMQAVRDAVRAAGAKGLDVAGHLAVTYVRDEPNSRGRGKDKKIYTAAYRLPAAQAAADVLMGTSTPNTLAGQPSPFPAPALHPAYVQAVAAAQPQPLQPTPLAVAAGMSTAAPAGVDPAIWARMAPEQQQTVLAAMGVTPPF